jgi:hypothetical protein
VFFWGKFPVGILKISALFWLVPFVFRELRLLSIYVNILRNSTASLAFFSVPGTVMNGTVGYPMAKHMRTRFRSRDNVGRCERDDMKAR